MLWIIQLPNKSETEIWSDEKLAMMNEKCLFYGATPHWVTIKPVNDQQDSTKTTQKKSVQLISMRKAG
jgi:hypothetical protein